VQEPIENIGVKGSKESKKWAVARPRTLESLLSSILEPEGVSSKSGQIKRR
jgi:hypothetical protein